MTAGEWKGGKDAQQNRIIRMNYALHLKITQLYRKQGILKNGTGQIFSLRQDMFYLPTLTWVFFFLFHWKSVQDYCHNKMTIFHQMFLSSNPWGSFPLCLCSIFYFCVYFSEVWVMNEKRWKGKRCSNKIIFSQCQFPSPQKKNKKKTLSVLHGENYKVQREVQRPTLY